MLQWIARTAQGWDRNWFWNRHGASLDTAGATAPRMRLGR